MRAKFKLGYKHEKPDKPSWLCTNGLQSMTAGSSRCELQIREIENNVNSDAPLWSEAHAGKGSVTVLTDGKKGVFDIPRHLFLDDLLNVLVGESNKLLEHCE